MFKIASITLLLLFCTKCALSASAFYRDQIEISADAASFNSEKFYANLTDYANSPLVECAYLYASNYYTIFSSQYSTNKTLFLKMTGQKTFTNAPTLMTLTKQTVQNGDKLNTQRSKLQS